MKKYIIVEKSKKDRFIDCAICGNKNDHYTGRCCEHVYKVTDKNKIYYRINHK